LKALAATMLGTALIAFGGEVSAQGMGSGDSMGGGGQMGGGGFMGGGHMGMLDSGGVHWPDTLEVVTVSGVALVEKNGFHDRFALDTDSDGNADYQLSFGPWWYEPESGAVRPSDGTTVLIKGGTYSFSDGIPLLLAFEIDDLPWRDQGELLPWSGGWMNGAIDSTYFHAPQDSMSWMGFPSGAMEDLRGRMMGFGVASDSAYFHFEHVDRNLMPGLADSTMIAGYHSGFSDPMGIDLVDDEMGMSFSHGIEMHLHYDTYEMAPGDLLGHDVILKTLGKDGKWIEVPDVAVNFDENTLSLMSKHVSSYYAVFTKRLPATAIEEETQSQTPATFALFANFPNPFNAGTMISYDLAQGAWVKLEIINTLGQPVRTLVDGPQRAGYASVQWDGRDDMGREQASGIYLYRLKADKQVEMRKLLLLR